MTPWRPWSAGATALGLALASLVAMPTATASACTCGGPSQVDTTATTNGRSMAIVTRLDEGGPRADFAIEATWGAEMPKRVTADIDDNGTHCRPWVDPRGGVGAVVFNRELLGWNSETCGTANQEEVFLRALGNPIRIAGGPPVAIASGRFGGSNLVAVDAVGTPVAWGNKTDGGGPIAACPSGRIAAALDRATGEGDEPPRLTLHRVKDLTTNHSTTVPLSAGERVQAIRCADRAGALVEILVNHDQGLVPPRVLSIRKNLVVHTGAGAVRSGVPMSDGFLAVSGTHTLVRLKDGRSRVVVRDLGLREVGHIAVRADEAVVAVWGRPYNADDAGLRVYDLRSGMLLASKALIGDVTGLTWSGAALIVRRAGVARRPAPAMQVLNHRLHLTGHLLTPTGTHLTNVAGAVLTYGSARATLVALSGRTRALPMVRLAAADHIVGVPGRTFGE